MDADLEAELASKAPFTVLLVTYYLGGEVVRWTDGGFVRWDDDLYQAKTSLGVLSEISEISDGVDGEASSADVTLLPADNDAFATLVAPDIQGCTVSIHFGAVSFETGQLIGEPDLLFRGEVDVPRLTRSGAALIHECITEEARMLEVNAERRLTDAFHQSVHPGELGYANVTGLDEKIYWRAEEPNNAISR